MSVNPIEAIGAISAANAPDVLSLQAAMAPTQSGNVSFAQLFQDGIDAVSQQAVEADSLVKAFVLDDSIAPHRVMYALQQSQLSLQMMLQVRNRLVEGYQEIMRMQL